MASERDRLLGQRGPDPEPASQGSSSGYGNVLEKQYEEFREQEKLLSMLQRDVGSVKRVAQVVHGEVESQNEGLDDLESAMGRRTAMVGAQQRRAQESPRSPYTVQAFCGLLWPAVLLVLIFFWSLRYL